jgi:N-acetylmuramoyl-L-alanine amidase
MSAQADSPLAKTFPSPNHGERNNNLTPEMVILHYTGMPDAKSALKWMCTPESSVSSHYLVYESGKILQLVPESRRAWHAGAGSWRGMDDINSRSIGIEIVNAGHDGMRVDPDDPKKPLKDGASGPLPAFPKRQVTAVIKLLTDICARNDIPRGNILAHSDIAPRRKRDPGEAFPWDRLAAEGLGLWVEPTPIRSGHFWQQGDGGEPVKALQTMLAMLGYALPQTGVFDEDTKAVVAAFQRHWRPQKVDGVADYSTITTLRDVLKAMKHPL